MGLASYYEDVLTAFYEGEQTIVPPARTSLHLSQRCPFCNKFFRDKNSLNGHISSTHRGERPVLLIDGSEPAKDTVIRQDICAEDIRLINCTSVQIRKYGVALPEQDPGSVPALFTSEADIALEIDLIHKFDASAGPITQSYCLTLRVPDKQSLDAVDNDFVKILAIDALHISHIDKFLRRPSAQGVAREYADALASYVRGVLVKDGTGDTTLPFSEANGLYARALETLKGFRRPLTRVICSLVRLASNDFSLASVPTGFLRLDLCHAVLAPAVGYHPPMLDDAVVARSRKTVALCPVDQAIDSILNFASICLSRTSLEHYRVAIEHQRLTSCDRMKIYALHALTALQSGAVAEARESLRQLRNVYPFGEWASKELETLDG